MGLGACLRPQGAVSGGREESVFVRAGVGMPVDDFLLAAREGDMRTLKPLLDRYPHLLNERDVWDMTALMWAAYRGDTPMLEHMLWKGADRKPTTGSPPREGTRWETPESAKGHFATALPAKNALCLAYVSVHMDAYRRLLRDAPREELVPALLVAAIEGDAEWAADLLDHGAAPDGTLDSEKDKTPLVCAAINGHVETASLLVGRGASVQARYSFISYHEDSGANRYGWPVLLWAADAGRPDVVDLLLGAGADANAGDDQGFTALMLAAQRGDAAVAEALLRRGADMKRRRADGRTAADFAKVVGASGVLDLLRTFNPSP